MRLMTEIRARLVAAECPLTYTQVRNLAWQALEEDSRPEFEMWLLWSGAVEEVAEWLWQFWIENADGGPTEDLPPPLAPASRLDRPAWAPVTARSVGQKPARDGSPADWSH
jgi:hypothetical protein